MKNEKVPPGTKPLRKKIMSMATPMESALQDLNEVAERVERGSCSSHLVRPMLPISTHALEAAHRKIMEDLERKMQEFQEFIERYCAAKDVAVAQVERFTKHVLHRSRGRTSGTGKASAKKHASSTSGGGGDGGGDGDGPQHKPTERKKYRPNKIPSTALTHPPSVPTGEIAPQQLPPPQLPSQHRISPLAYLCMLGLIGLALTTDDVFIRSLVIIVSAIVVLCVIGHPDVAKQFLTSKTVPALIARLANLLEVKR